MSRVYTVQFTGVAVTAQQDLFELVAASTKTLRLMALFLSQSTEVGDTQEEGLSILIKSGQTTSGSGGSGPTPVPLCVTDAAAGFTAEVNNTTKATSGTIVTHHADNWNVRAPFMIMWPPEMRIPITGSRRLTIELGTTPADSITMSGTIYVEETG
jgi:hypothetical protein